MKNKNILFYTASEGIYNQFVLPFTFSHLHFNENSLVEISIRNCEQYKKDNPKEIEFLEKHFKDRYLFRECKLDVVGSIRRIIEMPELETDIAYIGDVDILCLRNDVYEHSSKILKDENLLTVNIVREGQGRITGCGSYAFEFFKHSQNYLKSISVPNSVYFDETLIYNIFSKYQLKMPPSIQMDNYDMLNKYRGLNGFHTSLNRNGNYDYQDNMMPTYDYRKQFKDFKETDIYKEFISCVNDTYKSILQIINQNVN